MRRPLVGPFTEIPRVTRKSGLIQLDQALGILVSDTKANNFWCIFEPLTREIWYYFSSVGEVYAAQQSPAGRFLLGVGHALQELRMRELPGRLHLRGLHTRELRLQGC